MNYQVLDEASLPLSEYIKGLTNFDDYQLEDAESGMSMSIEKIDIEMPCELDIRFDEYGNLIIGTTPPIYYVETSIMPTFHRMKISIEANSEYEVYGNRE